MKKLLMEFTVFTLLTTSFFAAKKTPSWIIDLESSYPNTKYIAQIGEGTSNQEAELNAQQKIARYFESNIDTTTLGRLQMSEHNGDVTQKRDLDSSTTITSNVQLFAFHYSEAYTDKKTKKTYVVSYIDRDEAFQIYKPKVDLPAQNFSNFYSNGEKEEKQGNYLTAYRFYKNAKNSAYDFEEKYCFAKLLNQKNASKYDVIHNQVASIDSKLEEVLLKCQLHIQVINDNNDIILSKAKNLFSDYGFNTNSDSSNYIAVITVTIDKTVFPKGTSCYPHINIQISDNNKTIITFGKDGEKISAVNEDVAVRRTYTAVEQLLEEAFYKEFMTE